MLRQQPKAIPEDTDYFFCEAHLRHSIFSHPDDYALIRTRQLASLRPTSALLLGYCWRPNRIHLAPQLARATSCPSTRVRYRKTFEEMKCQLMTVLGILARNRDRTYATARICRSKEEIRVKGDA